MNKKELREYVLLAAEELTGERYRKSDAELMIDSVFLGVEKALIYGDDVDIHGFGRFVTKQRAERQIHTFDPNSDEKFTIPARRTVHFLPGNRLKRNVAQGIFRPEF